MLVTHDKHGPGNAPLDEPSVTPTPFNAYQYGALSSGSTPGTPVPTGKRAPPSSDGGYPNPWGSVLTTSEGAQRTTSPPAPTSEGSIYSGTAMSMPDHTSSSAHRSLQVRNPHPAGPPIPMTDLKDRTIFLSADRGMQVYGGQSPAAGSSSASASAAGSSFPPSSSADAAAFSQGGASSSSEAGGSSTAPFVHQDAGVVLGSQPRRRTKAAEANEDASGPADAPPAYEA